jgi:hypothetical protein
MGRRKRAAATGRLRRGAAPRLARAAASRQAAAADGNSSDEGGGRRRGRGDDAPALALDFDDVEDGDGLSQAEMPRVAHLSQNVLPTVPCVRAVLDAPTPSAFFTLEELLHELGDGAAHGLDAADLRPLVVDAAAIDMVTGGRLTRRPNGSVNQFYNTKDWGDSSDGGDEEQEQEPEEQQPGAPQAQHSIA